MTKAAEAGGVGKSEDRSSTWRRMRHLAKYGVFAAALKLLHLLPFETRRRAAGALLVRVGPLSRRKRALLTRNLELAFPDLTDADRARIARDTWNGIGRSMAELHSPKDLKAMADRIEVTGPGLAAIEAAQAAGQGVLLLSGHYGQWEAVRLALGARGHSCGGFFREQSNPYYSRHLAEVVGMFGQPILPRGRAGTRSLIRILRDGGMMAMLVDQPMEGAPALRLFGHPARTVLAPAEIALKLDVLMVPVFGIRLPGTGFRAVFEAPIPPSTPEAMMQAFNDSLEAQVRAQPEQWLWPYDRWDLRRRAAAAGLPPRAGADLQ